MISPEEKEVLVKMGNLMRKLRKEKKLTQPQLAFEIGISRAKYQFMEKGETKFDILTLYKVANILDVHPRDLIFDMEKPESEQ